MTTFVRNLSSSTPIEMEFAPSLCVTDDKNTQSYSYEAAPGEEKIIPLESCGSALVKMKKGGKMFWEGIVPLNTSQPILVDPEKEQVSYTGQDIPRCESCSDFSLWVGFGIGISFLILVSVWYFLRKKRKN